MQDMQAQLVKLREQATEFTRIAARATDPAKRELFTRFSGPFLVLLPRWKRPSLKWPLRIKAASVGGLFHFHVRQRVAKPA